MGKYTKMSQQVLEKVGGLSNITFVEHCATRLRIHYASKSKVDVEAIKGIENVVGVVAKTGQVQIIIGPEVNDAFNDFLDVSGWKPTDDRPTVVEEEPEKKNALYYVNKFGNFCAGIFMPIVPALITGGLILAIKNLLVNYFGMSTDSGTAKICLAIFSAGFSMLPVWIGYMLSNKLKMEPIMGAFLGAVLVSNSISGVEGLDFFGIPIPTVTYTSSVLPIVMGVILMYWVDKLLKKIIPEMVRYFLKPLLTMLIVVPITLIVLGPIGTELSGVVGNAIQAFFNAAGFIALPICAAINPYLVMLGLDKAITPILVEGISSIGYDLAVVPMNYISNLAVGGSALAVAMHLKDKGRKGMIASFGVTALCGVTEPAFYGSLIMRPRVLIGTACGAMAGGLIAGIFQLKNYVVGGCPGFLALLFFLPSDGSMGNLILALVSGIVTVIVSFIACTIVLKKAYKEDV
jgi:PTS system beta-glucosides-specific IIC component